MLEILKEVYQKNFKGLYKIEVANETIVKDDIKTTWELENLLFLVENIIKGKNRNYNQLYKRGLELKVKCNGLELGTFNID